MLKRNNNGITNYHNFLIWENDRLFTSGCGNKVNMCDTAAPNEKCKKRYFLGDAWRFPATQSYENVKLYNTMLPIVLL